MPSSARKKKSFQPLPAREPASCPPARSTATLARSLIPPRPPSTSSQLPPRLVRCSTLLFFCNDPATTEIYTLSLHDALPILATSTRAGRSRKESNPLAPVMLLCLSRSEEHTSELQSRPHLVCRLLLEKK